MPGGDLLSHGECHTTIGAWAFHFSVRNGDWWCHPAVAAGRKLDALNAESRLKKIARSGYPLGGLPGAAWPSLAAN